LINAPEREEILFAAGKIFVCPFSEAESTKRPFKLLMTAARDCCVLNDS